jgi:hypothetical protein
LRPEDIVSQLEQFRIAFEEEAKKLLEFIDSGPLVDFLGCFGNVNR